MKPQINDAVLVPRSGCSVLRRVEGITIDGRICVRCGDAWEVQPSNVPWPVIGRFRRVLFWWVFEPSVDSPAAVP